MLEMNIQQFPFTLRFLERIRFNSRITMKPDSHELSRLADGESRLNTPSEEAANVPGYSSQIVFEPSESRKAVLKVDILIMPPIILCFCFLQFDRTNIGNALTDTLRTDINVGNSDINLAQTLFTVGFIITELPFNLISRYMGPERFLPITMFLWGIATWSQAFLKNAAGLCAARFFIGALEGGYIPGFALYISRYYTNDELALRFALFWASNSIAGALGGPLSLGLISLGGRGGLKGWQWLFVIGGCRALKLPQYPLTSSRGHLDVHSSHCRLSLSPARRRRAKDIFRQTPSAIYRARSNHYCHTSNP